jgi:hypothetical protein
MKYGKEEFASDFRITSYKKGKNARFYESMRFNKKKPAPFRILQLNDHQIICYNYYDYIKDSIFYFSLEFV